MDETVVRGLIIGATFMVVGIAASLAWKLIRSPSEGARRTRWVLGAAIGVPFIVLLAQDLGVAGTFVVVAALAAIIWIIKGFRAKS